MRFELTKELLNDSALAGIVKMFESHVGTDLPPPLKIYNEVIE